MFHPKNFEIFQLFQNNFFFNFHIDIVDVFSSTVLLFLHQLPFLSVSFCIKMVYKYTVQMYCIRVKYVWLVKSKRKNHHRQPTTTATLTSTTTTKTVKKKKKKMKKNHSQKNEKKFDLYTTFFFFLVYVYGDGFCCCKCITDYF